MPTIDRHRARIVQSSPVVRCGEPGQAVRRRPGRRRSRRPPAYDPVVRSNANAAPIRRATIANLGCKVNQAEMDVVERLLRARGLDLVDAGQAADMVVVNTCTVTSIADRKSRQAVRRARRANPDARLLVTGCSVSDRSDRRWPRSIRRRACSTTNRKAGCWPSLRVCSTFRRRRRSAQHFGRRTGGRAGWRSAERGVPVGCPIARSGRPTKVRSRTLSSGRHRSNAGLRQDPGRLLVPLHLLHHPQGSRPGAVGARRRSACRGASRAGGGPSRGRPDGHQRRNLGRRAAPARRVGDGWASRSWCGASWPRRTWSGSGSAPSSHSTSPTICSTSGSAPRGAACPTSTSRCSRATTRSCGGWAAATTPRSTRELVARVRRAIPGVAVHADLIAGFPGEDDAAWARTVAFLRSLDLAGIHVFRYSARPGTPAARMVGQVDARTKKRRAAEALALAAAGSGALRRAAARPASCASSSSGSSPTDGGSGTRRTTSRW